MLVSQALVNGLLLGGLYACVAVGFSLIWGVMNLINLAHGSFALLGAYVAVIVNQTFGIDPFLTIPFSGVALFGLVPELGLEIDHIHHKSSPSWCTTVRIAEPVPAGTTIA